LCRHVILSLSLFSLLPRPPRSPLFPYTTLFRSEHNPPEAIDGCRSLLLPAEPIEHRHAVFEPGIAATAQDVKHRPCDRKLVLQTQQRKCHERRGQMKRSRQPRWFDCPPPALRIHEHEVVEVPDRSEERRVGKGWRSR